MSGVDARDERVEADRARSVRDAFDLGDSPIDNLVELVELRGGCDVAVIAMPAGVDGMVAKDCQRGVTLLAVATTAVPARQRMTLAHELGHLEFDELAHDVPLDCTEPTPEETRANSFARHLLAPLDGVRAVLETLAVPQGDITDAHLSALVRHFRVSPHVAAIQLREAGWIDQDTVDRWAVFDLGRLATRYGWRAEYDLWLEESLRERPPRRLLQRAIDGYVAGVVPASAVAQVQGKSLDETLTQLNEDGIFPVEPEITYFDVTEGL